MAANGGKREAGWMKRQGHGGREKGLRAANARVARPSPPFLYLVYCVIGRPSYMSSMRRIWASRL